MKPVTLLSVGEAADYINLPRPTLYHHLREGNIPGIQIGGRWRIELEKLNQFMDRSKRGPDLSPNEPAPEGPPEPMSQRASDLLDHLNSLRHENRSLKTIVADNLLRLQKLRDALPPQERWESVRRFAESNFQAE